MCHRAVATRHMRGLDGPALEALYAEGEARLWGKKL